MANTVKIRGVFEDLVSGPLAGITKKFRALDDVVKGSGSLKSVLTGVGLAAGAKAFDILGNAIGGAGQFIQDSIGKASDFAETLSKTEAVFGDLADGVKEWAERSSEAFGQSRLQALSFASTFGALLQPMGIVGEEAAKQSMALTQLGADLASFYNTDIADALEAIKSGLTGQSEPLRRYGILLSETRVQQFAWSHGIAESGKQLTEQQKVLARIGLIMQDSATAQGDFQRTSSGLANSQRILAAELENAQIELGEKFLPLQLQATRAMIEFTKAITPAIDGIAELGDTLGPVAGGLGAIIGALNPARGTLEHYREEVERLRQAQEQQTAAADAWHQRLVAANDDAASAAQRLAGAQGAVATSAEDAGDAVTKAAKRIERTVPTVTDARRSWEDLGSSIAEAIFGPDILRGREAGLQRRLREIKDEMRKEHDPLRIKELKGDLADAQQQLVETRLKLTLLGDATAKDQLRPWIQGALQDIQKFDSSVQDAIRSMARLMGLSAQLGGMPNPFTVRARQHGGPVSAGEAYLVGERGPELFVPRVSGAILPGVPTAPMAPVRLEINLDGRRVAEVVDEHLGWRYAAAARTLRPV